MSKYDRVVDSVLRQFKDEYLIVLEERNAPDHLITRIFFYKVALEWLNDNPMRVPEVQRLVLEELTARLKSSRDTFEMIVNKNSKD